MFYAYDIRVIGDGFECEGRKDDMLKFLRRTYELKTGNKIPEADQTRMMEGTNHDFVTIAKTYHPQFDFVTKEEEPEEASCF